MFTMYVYTVVGVPSLAFCTTIDEGPTDLDYRLTHASCFAILHIKYHNRMNFADLQQKFSS